MEYIQGYEMFDFIIQGGRMPEGVARFYFQQLIEAIKHIHSRGVGHCDIKVENLMINRDLDLKIVDFGHARPLGRSQRIQVGTEYINDPAIYAINETNPTDYDVGKADLFSAGTVLLYMVLGTPLW